MCNQVYRCYVEKGPGFDITAKALQSELADVLGIEKITVRIINRYDMQNLSAQAWPEVMSTVLSEPMCDKCFEEEMPPVSSSAKLLCIEPLPGQFDARTDSCAQCTQMLLGSERPLVRRAQIYVIDGVTDTEYQRVKAYIINPLESRETSMDKPETLERKEKKAPDHVNTIEGFIDMSKDQLAQLCAEMELAMSVADVIMVQQYFITEKRNPTITEIRVMDTYWSDHCRHTTFNTVIEKADIQDPRAKKAYDLFVQVNGDKPITLMRMAIAAMKHLHKNGQLEMLDVSEENNACTVRIKANFEQGQQEDWLLFFKNETHNHPTEIEPFGGASTCIGGAIRDPLSGRSYVYQAMRITGAGDPTGPIEDTLPGKLPQRKLTISAAQGYSSYGNQIGLATGYVKELYHNGYIAKRLETGAVVGAAPQSSVRRERPAPGDIVVLLGGRTGRDGIGGATGSSKTHGTETVTESAAEVQKGNAPEERKLQRLFRDPRVTKLIKRCNDFGAGGVSVAIGELADGLEINLDAVPVKYQGLDGTELAISESQERMAVVVAQSDVQAMKQYAETENIEATVVATITEQKRLVMMCCGQKIVDIDRAFLDTNGAQRTASVHIPAVDNAQKQPSGVPFEKQFSQLAADLNFCSQKGLVERFDCSIGAASVFVPFGGEYALTETQVMAAKLPAIGAKTASVMAYGFDPMYTEQDPFAGSAYAVVTSVAKLAAAGTKMDTVHLSLQEFFPRVNDDATRWGLPCAAMLGAFSAQMGLEMAAIGGKDSMSGSFGELDVPPTLISFAVGINDASKLVSSEFKGAGHPVYLIRTPMGDDGLPDYDVLRAVWDRYAQLICEGKVLSAWACETGGVYGGVMKMAMGNRIGFAGEEDKALFDRQWGSIIFETTEELTDYELLGYTQVEAVLCFGQTKIPLSDLCAAWEAPLEGVFPVKAKQPGEAPTITDNRRAPAYRGIKTANPKAVIPVFPGTNCEYDTAAAIERAGGNAEIVLVRNLTPQMLQESIAALEKAIKDAQMIVFPGGFSGGDEPDGSGKFIVSLFRNQRLSDAVHGLLQNRDGLILGICNGFQALVKLGLLPYGEIRAMTADCPTLTFNHIDRHQSLYVNTRIASAMSPWLSKCEAGQLYVQPVSHGEGRFVALPQVLNELKEHGQIAFQYTDHEGVPSMDSAHNPNGSDWAIEGICSRDGRILGKMAHTERCGDDVGKNIVGNKFMPLFEGGVNYFK